MRIYLDKLAHVLVVINCRYSVAQMCTWEDTHTRSFFCMIGLHVKIEQLASLKTLVGPTRENLVPNPLTELSLNN